jgi:hypothetical protein
MRAKATISFHPRLDPATDALRRDLQRRLRCSGRELVSRALRELERSLRASTGIQARTRKAVR